MKSTDLCFPEPGTVTCVERTVPSPGPSEVRCRALTSLISPGTESFCLDGVFDPGTFWEEWVQYPFSPGYSMTSEIVDVGPDVVDFQIGDRVATSTPHQSVFNVTTDESVLIPDQVTNDQACWASLACTTQLGVRRAQLALGERVAVVGLGVLGLLVTQYLHLSGARTIIAIDPTQSRLALAKKLGATDMLADDVAAARDTVRTLTAGAMVDVAFDITGHPDALAPTTNLVHQGGRVILLGDTPTPSHQRLGPRMVADSILLQGVHASSAPSVPSMGDPWSLPAMTMLFFEWVAQGKLNVDDLVSHRFKPAQAPEVYQALKTDRSSHLGVLLDWDEVTA
jgi:threonine dehydrogenase-like Zn-dependent dehydrogenase